MLVKQRVVADLVGMWNGHVVMDVEVKGYGLSPRRTKSRRMFVPIAPR
jgi:hypothetical protein